MREKNGLECNKVLASHCGRNSFVSHITRQAGTSSGTNKQSELWKNFHQTGRWCHIFSMTGCYNFLIHTFESPHIHDVKVSVTFVYINFYFKNLFNHFESNVNTLRPYLK